ncbi:hypothetical protein ACFWPV_22305 [Streptomyces uncialis]|uniref:hypothetical protein n=1 Tax=Streptomyces uncialis TaxID=1048205 RepID=UPI00366245F6
MATLVPAVTTTATAAPAPATSPLARYAEQNPTWKRCDPRLPAVFQCAKVKVPLNYAKPGGKKLDIAISRYRTSTRRSTARTRSGTRSATPRTGTSRPTSCRAPSGTSPVSR